MDPPSAVVGGDRRAFEMLGAPLPPNCTEVACQQCGRPTLLTEESQRAALGDSVELYALSASGPDLAIYGKPFTHNKPLAVLCMWCAFVHLPEVLAKIPSANRSRRSGLGSRSQDHAPVSRWLG